MILYFMKQDALEFMKQNMDVLYTNYFTEETSDWINEVYGSDAFAIFKEVPDFELCELEEKSSGEVDFENIQKLFLAMKNLSESQAADERLWAGLCNKVFYDYLRRRWKYDENDITDAKKDASAILSRFFFSSGTRGSFFRNSLAKYWWVGKLTYDEENREDKFYALKAIGNSDLNSKITTIFYSNTFASNPVILKAITNALGVFYEKQIFLSEKDIIRPTMQYLNAVGGAILLDALSDQEITKIVVDYIRERLQGKMSVISLTEEEEEYEDEEDIPAVIFNSPDVVENLDFGFEDDNPKYVEKGNSVKVFIENKNIETVFKISKTKERKDMGLVERLLLGKKIDDVLSIGGNVYIVKEIL